MISTAAPRTLTLVRVTLEELGLPNGACYPEIFARAAEQARNHKWYDSAMQVVVNDLYSFDPDKRVELDEFTDVIARNFRQPAQGLGFDDSAVAHMWRTIIWPNNFL